MSVPTTYDQLLLNEAKVHFQLEKASFTEKSKGDYDQQVKLATANLQECVERAVAKNKAGTYLCGYGNLKYSNAVKIVKKTLAKCSSAGPVRTDMQISFIDAPDVSCEAHSY